MQEFNPSSMCDVVDITLYKNNYYDNLIFTKCLNQVDYTVITDDSILVTPRQLSMLLELNFEREIRKIEATSADLLHKDANSIFFIDRLIQDFYNLKWVKLNLFKTRHFSRVVETNGQKSIKFSFKVLKTTLRLNELFSLDEIAKMNPILKKRGIIKAKPYAKVMTKDLLHHLDQIVNLDNDIDDDTAALFIRMIEAFEFKYEIDNPEVLLVTDW